MGNIILDTMLVGSIKGNFVIKSYQRGYRWGKEEVLRLLDDIYSNGTKNYCLQPIVVKKEDDKYELIDGQQRLTTIYLIYQVMKSKTSGWLGDPKFSIEYEIRDKSKEFLDKIDVSRENENIDFYFLSNAYKTIDEWFSDKDKSAISKFNEYLDDNVKVIWYEVDDSINSVDLFTRLNIGKIPLTSAELVKAMFLSKDMFKDVSDELFKERQEEISLQWDNIEKRLHDDSLWYFLTNNSDDPYQTRIDLVLDLLTNKPNDCIDKYYTFFEIYKLSKTNSLQDIWNKIQHAFLILNDWFENHELYHKIGYLIASEYLSLQEIYELSKNKTKSELIEALDSSIENSIRINENYGELSYEKSGDAFKISKLLLLFNIESVRRNGEKTQWFPFDKFKNCDDDNVVWSLEHIHAQQSKNMQSVALFHEWLSLHVDSIMSLGDDNSELIEEMKKAISNDKLSEVEFTKLRNKVVDKLSTEGNVSYMHSIGNLALLNSKDNASLNNSTFDVKRNIIIKRDQEGKFIPFCTKMVFLKYYSPSKDNQLHFWGENDMLAYIDNINNVLEKYLDKKIVLQKEEA